MARNPSSLFAAVGVLAAIASTASRAAVTPSERVVFCVPGCAALSGGQPYRELGRLSDGMWAAIADDALLAVQKRSPVPELLYFSIADYDQAVRELAPQEIAQVIRHRRLQWAPKALDDALDWLYRTERRSLALTAFARAGSPAGVAGRLEEHFERTLGLLSRLVSEGRYDDVPLPTLLSFVLDGDVALRDQHQLAAEAARKANQPAEAQRRTQAAHLRQLYAERQAELLVRLGRQEYSQALPYSELEQVFYITPREPGILTSLRTADEPFFVWQEGIVAPWRVRRVSDLEKQGKTMTLLYPAPGEFAADLLELTPAQLRRELGKRWDMSRGRAPHAGVQDFLQTAALEQLLLKRAAVARARQPEPAVAQTLAEQVAQETDALRTALAMQTSWLSQQPRSGADALSQLEAAESAVARDAALFAVLAQRAGRASLGSRLAAIAAAKTQDLARIASLSADLRQRK